MKRLLALVALSTLLLAGAAQADAAGRKSAKPQAVAEGAEHPKSRHYRKAPQVRGYVERRGGYSYSSEDVVNTYGMTRSNYGGANAFRDPMLDRQSLSGPFDHGFFFDSGHGPRGGNSPYLH